MQLTDLVRRSEADRNTHSVTVFAVLTDRGESEARRAGAGQMYKPMMMAVVSFQGDGRDKQREEETWRGLSLNLLAINGVQFEEETDEKMGPPGAPDLGDAEVGTSGSHPPRNPSDIGE